MHDGTVKLANPKFKQNNSEYQIVFDKEEAIIKEANEDKNISQNRFNFTTIEEIEKRDATTIVDLAAFVKSEGSCEDVPLKNSNEIKSRKVITLYDDTGYAIDLTMWGDAAKAVHADRNSLVLIKGAKIHEYRERKGLSYGANTRLISERKLMPDDARIH